VGGGLLVASPGQASWVPRGPVTRGQILHWLAHEPGPWIPA
jgi:hypothetical protein